MWSGASRERLPVRAMFKIVENDTPGFASGRMLNPDVSQTAILAGRPVAHGPLVRLRVISSGLVGDGSWRSVILRCGPLPAPGPGPFVTASSNVISQLRLPVKLEEPDT